MLPADNLKKKNPVLWHLPSKAEDIVDLGNGWAQFRLGENTFLSHYLDAWRPTMTTTQIIPKVYKPEYLSGNTGMP